MDSAFVDTSGWVEFFVESAPFHEIAVFQMDLWQAEGRRVLTTNYVLTELTALLHARRYVSRPQRARIIDTIRSAAWVEVIHITPERDEAAWNLLKARPDKDWSLVDCASFVVMEANKMRHALTTDHHFAQAGFDRLLA